MSVVAALPLGAPGIYERPDVPLRALTNVRMDVCAFAGVAPRGPARVRWNPWSITAAVDARSPRRSLPWRVDSWDDYQRWFGGFEGPGLLPYAVASFFEQGGRRAYVLRIVHDFDATLADDGVAWGVVTDLQPIGLTGLPIQARTLDASGGSIAAELTWAVTPLVVVDGYRARVVLPVGARVSIGSLLRVRTASGRAFTVVSAVADDDAGVSVSLADEQSEQITAADLITATVRVTQGATVEVHAQLGLSPAHENWLADVLERDSALIQADPRWRTSELRPDDLDLALHAPTILSSAPGALARGRVGGMRMERDGIWLSARDEGSWSNALRAELSYRASPVQLKASGAEVTFARNVNLPVGSTLRLRAADGSCQMRRVTALTSEWTALGSATRVQRAELDQPLTSAFERAEVVEAELRVWEGENGHKLPQAQRAEAHTRLGLSPAHPRWIARVLYEESMLVYPAEEWIALELELPTAELPTSNAPAGQFAGGVDRYADITPEDFFDADWTESDEDPADGLHGLLALRDLSLVVAPDLYSPEPLADRSDVDDPGSLAGKVFDYCVQVEGRAADPTPDDLSGLRLDPRLPDDLAEITLLQQRLVGLAEMQRSFIVLLDVPPGLNHAQVQRWRAEFDSEFAAAYHPWLDVSRPDDLRTPLVRINPSAVAAGIIAQREEAFGVAYGPANVLALGVVDVAQAVTAAQHDDLHPLNLNVYLRERDGVRLTAARTLARRPEYRQLSVRRLVTMIMRTIEQQMQWVVFEPNDHRLRSQITHMLTSLLRQLQRANAFAGATEQDSFFVRCDEVLNPDPVVDAGRLIIEVGVAPAEPIEFIVLRIARGADGILRVED